MSRFSKTASVVANPFHALDHKARPCCALPREPRRVGEHSGYVGAKVDRANTRVLRHDQDAGDVRAPRQDTVFTFSRDPVKVPRSPYYRDALRSGALLPADKATAEWAGFKKFTGAAEALLAAEQEAEQAFEALYGEGSIAELRGRAVPEAPSLEEVASEPSTEGAPEAPGSDDDKAKTGRGGRKHGSNGGDAQ